MNKRKCRYYLFHFLCILYLVVIAVFVYCIKPSSLINFSILYILSFALYIYLILNRKTLNNKLLYFSIIIHVLVIFAKPIFSDTVNKNLYNAHLLNNGVNPYIFTPDSKIDKQVYFDGNTMYSYRHKEIAHTYTKIMPLNFAFFIVPDLLAPDNEIIQILILRSIVLVLEFFLFLFIYIILKKLGLSPYNLILLTLNPLVIMEITVNLNLPLVLMLFFLFLSLYFILEKKYILSSFFMGFSTSAVLLPAIFVPVFFRKLGFKKSIFYFLIVEFIVVISFLPFGLLNLKPFFISLVNSFIDPVIFNGSIWYIIDYVKTFNSNSFQLNFFGLFPVFIFLTFLILFSFNDRLTQDNFLFNALQIICITLIFLTPWVEPYIIVIPLAFSVFTNLRLCIIWSFLTTISYYLLFCFSHSILVVSVEYTIIILFIAIETIKKRTLPLF